MFTLTYSPLKADGHFVHHGHDGGQDEADGTRTTADKRTESCAPSEDGVKCEEQISHPQVSDNQWDFITLEYKVSKAQAHLTPRRADVRLSG